MTSRKPDNLIDKYLAAETTLEEEETLFDGKNQQPGIAEWATYRNRKRNKAPSNLPDTIWSTIQKRRRNRQRMLIGLPAVAASIAFVVFALIYDAGDQQVAPRPITYDEKEALLHEALSLFSEEQPTTSKQNVIYEDDVVIIYMTSQ
ncbi:MAG: hypothetical protein AAGA85_06455 [Bacteroidota bacterium]